MILPNDIDLLATSFASVFPSDDPRFVVVLMLDDRSLNDNVAPEQLIIKSLDEFKEYTREEIFELRKKKFLKIGKDKTFTIFSKGTEWIKKDSFFVSFKESLFKFKKEIMLIILLAFVIFLFLL